MPSSTGGGGSSSDGRTGGRPKASPRPIDVGLAHQFVDACIAADVEGMSLVIERDGHKWSVGTRRMPTSYTVPYGQRGGGGALRPR